jgi:hypothetical protein
MTSRRRATHGYALLAVLVALGVLGVGLTALAASSRSAARIAETRGRVEQARAAAFAGVHYALANWPADTVALLPLGATLDLGGGALPGGAAFRADVERTGAAAAIVRGHGHVTRGGGSAEWHVGRRIVLADIAAVAASVVAALSVAGPVSIAEGGSVSAEEVAGLRLDSAAATPDIAGAVSGLPPVDASGPAPRGPLDALEAAADLSATGPVTPRPRLAPAGSCDTSDAANWGDISGGPCGGYAPVVHAPAELRVAEGAGQGILIADGPVTFASGTVYRGVIVAGADVRVEPGALLRGAVIARAPAARVWIGGRIELSGADLREVLALALAGRPFDPPGRRWLPMF